MLPIADFDLCLMWASVHFVFRTEARAVRSSLGIEVAREFDNFSTLASLGLGLFHGVGRKYLRSR